MALSHEQQHELDELAAAVVDESITSAQAARLQQWLRESGEAQQRFVLAMGLHASLYGYAAEVEHEEKSDAAVAMPSSLPWRKRLARTVRLITRPTPFSLTVAALFIGLLVTAMAYIVAPMYQTRQRAGLAEIDATRIVAQLTRTQDAEWAEGQVGATAGAHLVVGHHMNLQRGLAEVKFNDGAIVLLAGPARLRIRDTGEAMLQVGKLRAQVPPEAIGFKITTPMMEIVDLGTEFGVEVEPDQSAEVHVLRGSVAVSPKGDASAGGRVVLAQGQAWKVQAGSGQGHAVAGDSLKFAMTLVDAKSVMFQAGRVDPITGGTYDGVDDVQLLQWGPSSNYGARADFDVGQNNGQRAHALLRFDLTSLQGKVDRILSVTLRLQPKTDAAYFPWRGTGEIELYRVSDANSHWREGTFSAGGGPGAGQEEATWNYLRHPSERWAGSGGAGKPGVDYEAEPLAAASYVPRTGYPLNFRLSGALEFVRDWIEGRTNGGFILREKTGQPGNRIDFHSSESVSAAARPQLIVVYLPKESDVQNNSNVDGQ